MMNSLIQNIPNLGKNPLCHVFEDIRHPHTPGTLWLEFGVASGNTINYISQFTNDRVFGFDSFEGLPEKWRDGFDKGAFSRGGEFPPVRDNVTLVKGWFSDTLPGFLASTDKQISFMHIDCDLYSSTKCILNLVKTRMTDDCIIVFDELVNYTGYDGDTGELRALFEYVIENDLSVEYIGMLGVLGDYGAQHENVALRLRRN